MTWRVGLIVFVLLVMVWTAGWWGGREAGLADGAPPAPTHRPAHIATSWSNRRHN
ncbi:hypothetical protein ACEOPT_30370 [Pseudomonas aeruginosa]